MMNHPPHPGEIVRYECLEPSGLNVTEGAKILGVARVSLSRLVNGHTGISPEMAIRLAKAFGSTPAVWLKMQCAYDLAQAEMQASDINVTRYRPQTEL